jgi:quercetin dioxygenase-like cupin family protein
MQPRVVPLDELRTSASTSLFEGGPHDVALSFFDAAPAPGEGPVLHTHPYAEVFLVHEGEATFTVAGEETVIRGGNVVIVPPETPHKFVNSGAGLLRIVTLHPSARLIQTDLE